MGERRDRSRHGRLRRQRDPQLVARYRQNALPRRQPPGRHRRQRRQQRRPQPAVEERTPAARRRDRSYADHPPFAAGTSKWNRIEHRLFSFITGNWRGQPLLTHQIIVELIAATRTDSGLTVRCRLDQASYPTGDTVSDDELANVNITRCDFHGEWNYAIAPRPSLTQSKS